MSGELKKSRIIVLLVVSMLVMSSLSFGNTTVSDDEMISYGQGKPRVQPVDYKIAYTPHDPIAIDGDDNFTETALVEGWNGDGSSGNPFIIEGLEIDCGSFDGHCININNTQVNFTIRNCHLFGAKLGYRDGIYLDNVINGRLVDNDISKCYIGINIDSSSSIILINNTLTRNSGIGIRLIYSSYCSVLNNTCTINYRGIYLAHVVEYTEVIWNVFADNLEMNGMDLMAMDNTFDYNYWGDYNGSDGDDDGIGDTPYVIPGSGSQDTHPLMLPPVSSLFWLEKLKDQFVEYSNPVRYDLNTSLLVSWWLNDTLHFNIDQNGIITNATNLDIGIYGIEVLGNFTSGYVLSGEFSVIIIDTLPPSWIQEPEDKVIEYGQSFNYKLNVTDKSDISSWWLNSTLYFNIDAGGRINSIGLLPVGIYHIEVNVNDTYNNILSYSITITVADTTAPGWDEISGIIQVEYGNRFICNPNATDLSGLNDWWVDDTNQFWVDWTGNVRSINMLEPGDYALRVYVDDIYGNTAEIPLDIEIIDTTPPEWIIPPINQYLEKGAVLQYQLSASDLSGIEQWSLNNTEKFSITSTGLITSNSELDSGHYGLLVTVSDQYGNDLSAVFSVNVSILNGTTTTTITTTTSVTTMSTSPPFQYAVLIIGIAIGMGFGVIASFIIVIVYLKKKS